MKRLIAFCAAVALALIVTSNALADPRVSATASVNSDRSISASWSPAAGTSGGALIVNTSPQTDATGELPDNNSTIDFELLNSGATSFNTAPLQDLAITQPTTVYVQIQLVDPFGDGSCSQGTFGVDCDSQVIPVVIQPHPQVSATATVNADRSVSFGWNVPVGEFHGAVIINTTSLTDATGELPFNAADDPTIKFDLLNTGWTSYKTLPLNMTITQPTTVYAQVQLDDPFGDGSCSQGSFFVDCDSQVIPLTIQPICSQTVVTPGHYTKKLTKRAHWLLRHGKRVKWSKRYHRPPYVKRHGYVWVKATYKKVWIPPVYSTQCH